MKAYLSKAEKERIVKLMGQAGCTQLAIAQWEENMSKGQPVEQPGPLGVGCEGQLFFTQLHETYFDTRQPSIITAKLSQILGGGQ